MKTIKISHWTETPKNFTGIVEYKYGSKYWYREGKPHREDGPAIEGIDGHKEWWIEGKPHREDGPACEYSDGVKVWCKEGRYHRLNGPALEYPDGSKEWWVEDKQYFQIIINDFVVLDYYKGEYNLIWYKLLNEDKIIDYPDIPGLIQK